MDEKAIRKFAEAVVKTPGWSIRWDARDAIYAERHKEWMVALDSMLQLPLEEWADRFAQLQRKGKDNVLQGLCGSSCSTNAFSNLVEAVRLEADKDFAFVGEAYASSFAFSFLNRWFGAYSDVVVYEDRIFGG